MDRAIVTQMVEDYWRAFMPAIQDAEDQAAATKNLERIGTQFEQRIEEVAGSLEPLQAASFRQFVDAERERLMAEYRKNPVAMKRRLALPLGIDAGPPPQQVRSGGMVEYAAKTAVRATIWESVWALFRAFR